MATDVYKLSCNTAVHLRCYGNSSLRHDYVLAVIWALPRRVYWKTYRFLLSCEMRNFSPVILKPDLFKWKINFQLDLCIEKTRYEKTTLEDCDRRRRERTPAVNSGKQREKFNFLTGNSPIFVVLFVNVIDLIRLNIGVISARLWCLLAWIIFRIFQRWRKAPFSLLYEQAKIFHNNYIEIQNFISTWKSHPDRLFHFYFVTWIFVIHLTSNSKLMAVIFACLV